MTWRYWANLIQSKPLAEQEGLINAGPGDLTNLFSATPLESNAQLQSVSRDANRAAEEVDIALEVHNEIDQRIDELMERKRTADEAFYRDLGLMKRDLASARRDAARRKALHRAYSQGTQPRLTEDIERMAESVEDLFDEEHDT